MSECGSPDEKVYYKVLSLPKMLVETGIASSRTEAERLVKAGAVWLNGHKLTTMKLVWLSCEHDKFFVPSDETIQ